MKSVHQRPKLWDECRWNTVFCYYLRRGGISYKDNANYKSKKSIKSHENVKSEIIRENRRKQEIIRLNIGKQK